MIYYSVDNSFLNRPHYFSMNSIFQDDGFGNRIIVNPDMDELLIERQEESKRLIEACGDRSIINIDARLTSGNIRQIFR